MYTNFNYLYIVWHVARLFNNIDIINHSRTNRSIIAFCVIVYPLEYNIIITSSLFGNNKRCCLSSPLISQRFWLVWTIKNINTKSFCINQLNPTGREWWLRRNKFRSCLIFCSNDIITTFNCRSCRKESRTNIVAIWSWHTHFWIFAYTCPIERYGICTRFKMERSICPWSWWSSFIVMSRKTTIQRNIHSLTSICHSISNHCCCISTNKPLICLIILCEQPFWCFWFIFEVDKIWIFSYQMTRCKIFSSINPWWFISCRASSSYVYIIISCRLEICESKHCISKWNNISCFINIKTYCTTNSLITTNTII